MLIGCWSQYNVDQLVKRRYPLYSYCLRYIGDKYTIMRDFKINFNRNSVARQTPYEKYGHQM